MSTYDPNYTPPPDFQKVYYTDVQPCRFCEEPIVMLHPYSASINTSLIADLPLEPETKQRHSCVLSLQSNGKSDLIPVALEKQIEEEQDKRIALEKRLDKFVRDTGNMRQVMSKW